MNDSSEFYGIVLTKPLPDRYIVETRYGRLEIPIDDITAVIDYRFNFVMRDDIRKAAVASVAAFERKNLSRFLSYSRLQTPSVVAVENKEFYRGYRYRFDDSAHVIILTNWGDLVFPYNIIRYVQNYSGTGDKREEFLTTEYLAYHDPRAWQGFVTPTALPAAEGSAHLTNYLLGSLQMNYTPLEWMSLNLGGAFIPFLPNTVKVITAGARLIPFTSRNVHLAAGVQGLSSEVIKKTNLVFPYAAVTYGNNESNLSALAGIAYKEERDTHLVWYKTRNALLAFVGAHRVGQNLKLIGELFFIDDFDIVPFAATVRYFENKFTIDIGVVFSLFKAGAVKKQETIGEILFGASDFPVVPVISGSYHF